MKKPGRVKKLHKIVADLHDTNLHLQVKPNTEHAVILKPGVKVILAERVTYKRK